MMVQAEIRKREASLPVGVGVHSDAVKCCSFDKLTPYARALSGSWFASVVHLHCLSASDLFGASCRDFSLLVWDLETHVASARLTGHTARVTACTLSGERNLCASGSLDSTCRIWDLRSSSAAAALKEHKSGITSCALSVYPTHEPLLWTGSHDGEICAWDMRKMQLREILRGHYDAVLSASLSQARPVVSGCNS